MRCRAQLDQCFGGSVADQYGVLLDDTVKRQQRDSERCALLQLLLLYYSQPGRPLSAAQLLTLAASFQESLFAAPQRPRSPGSCETDDAAYSVDLVRVMNNCTRVSGCDARSSA